MFKEKDSDQLKQRGIHPEEAEKQINHLRKGFPFVKLAKAATVNHGIKKLDETELNEFTRLYESADGIKVIKFIPASGAATRMFKAMFEFDEFFRQSDHDDKILQKEAYKQIKESFDQLENFAFYKQLSSILQNAGTDIREVMGKRDYHVVLSTLLGDEGLNYGNMPKGLLTFHRYGDDIRTAVEEHLVEGAGYAVNKGNRVLIHLTVSPEHKSSFESLMSRVQKKYETRYQVNYEISYSVQKPSTDTLAIDDKNEPFRESDGSLHFRPGGHGALLENLNEMDADIVFIKNIDNVSHDRNKGDTFRYKKALAGLLLSFQWRVFQYVHDLESNAAPSSELIREISEFMAGELGTSVNEKMLKQPADAGRYLLSLLNRPIRVCGMVKNEGEPGGGPFWIYDPDGSLSLQIIESSQVDHHDPEQQAILHSATHFNPVDLVCGVRDHRGKKFNLLNFRDPDSGFISKKYKNGKSLKALELPGLWNGSMAHWNTIFVEVPVTTFTPVKTMHDLLRPEHQEK